ncbi:MAG: peptidoglycan DD-metalloendopeptidase family protein [Fusobacteriaceae bacterium]
MIKIRYNIILILFLILFYRVGQLKFFSDEVIDMNQFTDYFNQDGQGEDGEILLASNYYVMSREYKNNVVQKVESGMTIANSKKYPNDIKIVDYVIVAGDNLSEIQKMFDVDEYVMRYFNPRLGRYAGVGQVVKMPTSNGIVYKVQKDDTLFTVAQKFKVSVGVITSYNNLTAQKLEQGQSIFIKDPDRGVLFGYLSSDARLAVVASGFVAPLKPVVTVSRYGNRFHPILRRYIAHTGLDLQARYVKAFATKEGTVTFVGAKSGYGNMIIIRHAGGYESVYAHIEKSYVEVGDRVKQGQLVVMTGASGRVTGPHLHFEIRRNGKPVNPMSMLIR